MIIYLNVSAYEFFARLQLALKLLMPPNYANAVLQYYSITILYFALCEIHLMHTTFRYVVVLAIQANFTDIFHACTLYFKIGGDG